MKPIAEYYYQITGEIILSPDGFVRMLEGIYSKYAELGFFISQETLLEWARKGTSLSRADTDPVIESVVIITRNRIPTLKRALGSYIANSKKHAHKADFLIFDDSPDEKVRAEYRKTLRAASQELNAPVFYAGREEKESYISELIRSGIPDTIAQFALFDTYGVGQTYGANRNAFLLETSGQMIFSADDDTVCELAKSPAFKEGVRFGREEGAFDMWLFPDRAQVNRALMIEDKNLFKLHEKALGRKPGEMLFLAQTPEQIDIEKISFSHLNAIQKGSGKVLATFNGTFGDSGSNSPLLSMMTLGEARKHCLQSELYYRSVQNSRETIKAAEQFLIEKAGPCMTTSIGLDNREILPPFFPVYRNEDKIFGYLLNKCYPEACFAYIPWVLAHKPDEERQNISVEEFQKNHPLWPCDAVEACLQSFAAKPGTIDLTEEIKRAGRHLKDISNLRFEEYREIVLNYQRMTLGSSIASIEATLKKFPNDAPYWVKDLQMLLESEKQKSKLPFILAPESMANQMGLEKAERLVQTMVGQFGELMMWWPAMIEAAKDLRRKGIRMSQPMHNNPQP